MRDCSNSVRLIVFFPNSSFKAAIALGYTEFGCHTPSVEFMHFTMGEVSIQE